MSCPFCKSKKIRPLTAKDRLIRKRYPLDTMYCRRCYAKYDPTIAEELKAEIRTEMARLKLKYTQHDLLCTKIINRMEWIL